MNSSQDPDFVDRFIKALFAWCEQRGKTLVLNCPEASMPVLHLCHAVTGDSKGPAGHWSMSERLATAAAGKRFQLLGIGGVPVSSAQ